MAWAHFHLPLLYKACRSYLQVSLSPWPFMTPHPFMLGHMRLYCNWILLATCDSSDVLMNTQILSRAIMDLECIGLLLKKLPLTWYIMVSERCNHHFNMHSYKHKCFIVNQSQLQFLFSQANQLSGTMRTPHLAAQLMVDTQPVTFHGSRMTGSSPLLIPVYSKSTFQQMIPTHLVDMFVL